MSHLKPTYATYLSLTKALDARGLYASQAGGVLDAASRAAEDYLHRVFYPTTATRYFDWPDSYFRGRGHVLDLHANELISVSSLTAGGTVISSSDYFLEPVNSGPPYDRIEIDLSSSAQFKSGDTRQRAIEITGLWGYDDKRIIGVATLDGSLSSASTITAVDNSASVGVGDLLIVESERLIITGRTLADTTVNLNANLTASKAEQTVTVTDSTTIFVGEQIVIDDEQMEVAAKPSGTTLSVIRATGGTTLAAHTSGADIWAPRSLTVERGALGTTAAAHNDATQVNKQAYPALVTTLTIAEALNIMLQEESGWARTVGSGEFQREQSGRGLSSIRRQAFATHGRVQTIGI